MNIMTIFYKRRDPTKFFELIRLMASSDIKQKWDNEKSTFQIIWEWPQKEEVINLLSFFKETFLDATINIANDVDEARVSNEYASMKIEEVGKEDIVITSENGNETEDTSNDDISFDIKTNFETAEEVKIAEVEIHTKEELGDVEPSAEAIATESKSEIPEEKSEEIHSDAVLEDNVAKIQGAVLEEKDSIMVDEASVDETSCESPPNDHIDDSSKEKGSKKKKAKKEQVSKPPQETEATVSCNPVEELRVLLTPVIEAYDFAGNFKDSAEKFCMNQGIKNEAFVRLFALSELAPSMDVLYSGVARVIRKNVALTKIEVKKSFDKWLKSISPDIYEKCPGINVVHFLNIFRKDDEKF